MILSADKSGSKLLDRNDLLTATTSLSEMLVLGAKVSHMVDKSAMPSLEKPPPPPEGFVYLDPTVTETMMTHFKDAFQFGMTAMNDVAKRAAKITHVNRDAQKWQQKQTRLEQLLSLLESMAKDHKKIGTQSQEWNALERGCRKFCVWPYNVTHKEESSYGKNTSGKTNRIIG